MSLLLALAAQVGPFVSGAQHPTTRLPPEMIEQKSRQRSGAATGAGAAAGASGTAAKTAAPPAELGACLAAVTQDPNRAEVAARTWLAKADAGQKHEAGHCLGVALARLERWQGAEDAFLAARDSAPADDHAARARIGALAGNAALARGDARAALAALDSASGAADLASEPRFAGEIELDRARALVMIDRVDEAATALARARAAVPGDAEVWLLSATLSRRTGALRDAQQQIEKAAELLPIDPRIGLEAGIIAVLSGRDPAARRSWQSVIDAAPQSEAAATARRYLQQLGDP